MDHDDEDDRRSYSFGGRHGQFSFPRVLAMLAAESGITGDQFRLFWYCAIMTYEKGGATAGEAAKFLGLTPQATRRLAKELLKHKIFLVEEVIGRTIKYKATPHIVSSLSGREQSELAANYNLPTVPGRSDTAPKGPKNASPKPVPGARRSAVQNKRPAAPEAELGDDVRDPGRVRPHRRANGG
ncbi:MarR family transcriptional regulator [Streptomyces sp. NPDC005017]|uniref:MarR family transcriptional regulator n=1 Tax=Streptomyces sp. NPDC005017 TaxID=3364706 RepID=UPI0036AA8DFC